MTEEELKEVEERASAAQLAELVVRHHLGELDWGNCVATLGLSAGDVPTLITALRKSGEWIADLQSGMYINCVYCGHRYGPDPGTPVAMADVLKAHVEKCPRHPMSELRRKVLSVLEPLAELGGGPDMQAFHDLEDDVMVPGLTAGDVREARRLVAAIKGQAVSEMHFRPPESPP